MRQGSYHHTYGYSDNNIVYHGFAFLNTKK